MDLPSPIMGLAIAAAIGIPFLDGVVLIRELAAIARRSHPRRRRRRD